MNYHYEKAITPGDALLLALFVVLAIAALVFLAHVGPM